MDIEHKIFDRIPIPDQDWEVIRDLIEGYESIESGIEFLTRRLKARKLYLWNIIYEKYPDLIKYEVMVNKDKQCIVILNTKKDERT